MFAPFLFNLLVHEFVVLNAHISVINIRVDFLPVIRFFIKGKPCGMG